LGVGPSEVVSEILASGTGCPSFVTVTEVSVIAHARPDHASTMSVAMAPLAFCITPPSERKYDARNANAVACCLVLAGAQHKTFA
jgi:hypothetical protein